MLRNKAFMMAMLVILSLALLTGTACARTSKVKLSRKTLTITEGKSASLKLKGAKAGKVKWKSSNKRIASVTSRGKVKARKAGKTKITARYKGRNYICKVTVKSIPNAEADQEQGEDSEMTLTIDGKAVKTDWLDNDSVKALKELAKTGPIEISMSKYGGFEQVGSLGKSIVRADKETTTEPGDIVLYQGNQIVIFYGSNSWSYTRLGHMDLSKEELTELLGGSNVTVRITV